MEPNAKCPIHGDEHERAQCTTESVKLIFPQGEVTVKFVGNIIFGMHKCGKRPCPPLGVNIAGYMGEFFWVNCNYCGLYGEFGWNPERDGLDNLARLIFQAETRDLTTAF